MVVEHPQDLDFVTPLAADRVLLKVRVDRGVARSVEIAVAEEGQVRRMGRYLSDARYDYFACEAACTPRSIHYMFKVTTADGSVWHTKYGTFAERPVSGYYVLNYSPEELFDVPQWVTDAVFYQIVPDRFERGGVPDPEAQEWSTAPAAESYFGGNLQGIEKRVAWLEALGITALYLTPVFDAPSTHRYDTRDYYRIDPRLGDVDRLNSLVRALHQRDIRIVLDGVFNHTSDRFWAFQDLLTHGEQSAYAHWYFVDGFPVQQNPPNYTCWWAHPSLPKLNAQHPDVEQYLLDVAAWWIEHCDIDGWRLDVPDELPHRFWQRFRQRVRAERGDAYILGELWFNGRPWLNGDQFDGVMNYRLRRLILDWVVDRCISIEQFDTRLQRLMLDYPEPALFSSLNLLSSHDTPRLWTLCGQDMQKLTLAVVLQMTLPGVPSVYYGEEVGLEGGADPDCRRCFPWDETSHNRDILALYQRLIHLRKNTPPLRRSRLRPLLADQDVYAYMRGDMLIIIHNGPGPAHVQIDLDSACRTAQIQFGEATVQLSGHHVAVDMPPYAAVIVQTLP